MKPSQETGVDRLLRARAEIEEALRRHKTAQTVLFSDVVGSTSYFDRFGDTAGFAMLQRQSDLCSRVIAEQGGTVIKTIGDSVMAEFPGAAAGVRAAIAIQRQLMSLNEALADREPIRVRIGIHTGTAYRREKDIFGDAVNLAARITKRTGPAQILVSRTVHDALAGETDAPCVWLGKVTIDGRSEKEDVYEVLWTDAATYRALRESVTAALARGELISPGLKLEDLVGSGGSSEGRPAGAAVTPAQTSVTPLPDRYEVLGEAGRGGMGVVYKARDRETGETIAIKLLMPNIASDEKMIERFKNELRLARKITHKYVCRTYDLYRTAESAFISMEFVEGESLRSALNRFGTLSLRKTIQLGRQICEGLQEAHAQGVVHRDLKPENVILDAHGNVKLMDFGIARSLDISSNTTGVIVGTPAYMAPEQAEGRQVDARADIYALGLILYEALTGLPAFVGETPLAVAVKQIQEIPTPPRLLEPSIPPHTEAVILRCLEKDPALRFASAELLGEALCASASEAPAEKHPYALPFVRLAIASALLVLLGGVFWMGRWTKAVPPSTQQASVAANKIAQAPVSTVPGSALPASKAGEGAAPMETSVASSAGTPITAAAVARNQKELEALQRQNEQVRYYNFDLRESVVFTKVGPALVRLSRASGKKQLYTLVFSTRENVVDVKDRTTYEPIHFYDERTRRTLEVVAYRIEDGHVLGYLGEPGPAASRPPIPISGAGPKNR